GLGCRSKKMAAAIPSLGHVRIHEPEVRFMHQCGRLERLAWLLLRESLCGELAQLVVDQRQELFGGMAVPLLNGREDACDLAHGGQDKRDGEKRQGWSACLRTKA